MRSKSNRLQESRLPVELRVLVKQSGAELGKVILHQLGKELYEHIEIIRKTMASLRTFNTPNSLDTKNQTIESILNIQFRKLRHLSPQNRLNVAHAFSILLELMNSCENAYRTYRLQILQNASQKKAIKETNKQTKPTTIVYVLTAHPTEAKSPKTIYLFQQIQELLVKSLKFGFDPYRAELNHLLQMIWKLPLSRERKPSVKDEAAHVYSIVLREDILSSLLDASSRLAPLDLRSWVGGDKDGHSGVNETTVLDSLQISRDHLAAFVKNRISEVKLTLRLLNPHDFNFDFNFYKELNQLHLILNSLKKLGEEDGRRVSLFHKKIAAFSKTYQAWIGVLHPSLLQIVRLLKMFPGLVVPLELRESSELIEKSVKVKDTSIERMLVKIKDLSKGGRPEWYAGVLIVSMVSSFSHLQSAAVLMKRTLGDLLLPIVPLFEQEEALQKAPAIIDQMIQDSLFKRAIRVFWSGSVEMMLGYSDSAKQMGVLPSRFTIRRAVCQLDELCLRHRVTPLFFHGSGGSVDRGGGSIQEQTDWWPASALRHYKATIQGEMIARTFASREILQSQLERIASRQDAHQGKSCVPEMTAEVRRFVNTVRDAYQSKIGSPDFMNLLYRATPYRYLSALKLGSRPVSRSQVPSISSLRAIPWVLCWTQTRVLFQTWWGVGSAWSDLSPKARKAMRDYCKNDLLFQSWVKNLGFTLAKVELDVWRFYLKESGISAKQIEEILTEFNREYQLSVNFVRSISKRSSLLWFRPWLGESIQLRAPMIHPLNLLQIISMNESKTKNGSKSMMDIRLLRETVTGISSGMMTTG